MEMNFGLKKTWGDLVADKEALDSFIKIAVALLILTFIDVFLKVKVLSAIGNLIFGSYLVLMANNIINGRTPILDNLRKSNTEERNLGMVVLKLLGIGVLYGVVLTLLAVIVFSLLYKVFMIPVMPAAIILMITLLPLIIIISLSNMLFAENLKFGDAFNIPRAVKSFKVAWKKYLQVFFLYVLAVIAVLIVLLLITIPLTLCVIFLSKNYPALGWSKDVLSLISGGIGSVIGQVGGIFLAYWYRNVIAQVYRYSVAKMDGLEPA